MSRFQHGNDDDNDEEEPLPAKPNTRHTVYFSENPS